ncbi:MAG: O-methyltransferase [Thermoproteota archaeon]|nr:O-methyltransferase [Thermoproteota archaeon]
MVNHNINKNYKIMTVIDKLEKQSELEHTGKTNTPHNDLMLAITRDTGKFLNILLSSMNANRILEVGTSTGYSTLWFALALTQNENNARQKVKQNIITIDNNPQKVKRAEKNFTEAEVQDKIKIIEGNALDVLSKLSNHNSHYSSDNKDDLFDFIFLDADKENLINYFDMALPLLRKRGVVVTDNVLYPEEYRLQISQYIKHIRRNESTMSVTVPIGYGEEITIKIK